MRLTATDALPTNCEPVNKQAALGISQHGEVRSTFECPPLSAVPLEIVLQRHPKFEDLRGARRGTVVVVGLHHWDDDGKSKWVVRCDCGRYELRSHKSYRRGVRKGIPDQCDVCDLSLNREHYVRKGLVGQ